jgi:prephenate dehydratase
VIAAERCAELFGLRVLERRIQDLKSNFTTFVAAGPEARLVSAKTRQEDSSRRRSYTVDVHNLT